MALLDIAFDEITPTRVTGSVAADERHHQPWGLVHGGQVRLQNVPLPGQAAHPRADQAGR